jgi:predicted nuclease of predicted toxin-antitoxin system
MSVRFFIDQCVPRFVSESLQKAGYQTDILRDHLPTDAVDTVVIAHAQTLDAILVTLNGDFASIINYPPANYGGIIALQVRNHPKNLPAIVLRLLTYLSSNPEHEHYAGKLILVEVHRIRIKE